MRMRGDEREDVDESDDEYDEFESTLGMARLICNDNNETRE